MGEILIALIVFSALIIYLVKACQSYCGPNDVLHLREKRRIVNGKPEVCYVIGIQDVKIPVNRINFVKPFYKEALLRDEVEDLNVVILLDGKRIQLEKKQLSLYPTPIFPEEKGDTNLLLKLDYREFEANLQAIKEAKVLIRSGEVPIGEATIGVEIH